MKWKLFLLSPVKFSSIYYTPTCFTTNFLYNVYDLSLRLSFHCSFQWRWLQLELNVLWKTYGTFLNSFHQDVKRLIWKFEWINDKRGRYEVSVLYNQTRLNRKCHLYIFSLVQWKKKKVNVLKWISPQLDLLLDYLFFFNMRFWRLKSSSGS